IGLRLKCFPESVPERFEIGKYGESVRRIEGNAFNEVEVPVALGIVYGIEFVEPKDFDELTVSYRLSFLKLRVVDTGAVVAIYNAQLKPFLGELVNIKGIDVLHHQIPCRDDDVLRI